LLPVQSASPAGAGYKAPSKSPAGVEPSTDEEKPSGWIKINPTLQNGSRFQGWLICRQHIGTTLSKRRTKTHKDTDNFLVTVWRP
jgi:hypothetical protein